MAERITLDKPYNIMGEPNARMISNIDEMLGQLYWQMAQLENKLSSGQGLVSSNNTSITEENEGSNSGSLTRWLSGPWTLDNVGGTDKIAGIVVSPVSTGTYNNFSPSGIDKAVSVEIEPSGGTVTLTGLESSGLYQRRFLFLRNRDSVQNLVLKHENSGSLGRNQFRLPDSVDVTLGPRQAIWLFFDPAAGLWYAAVTPHTSGGLATMSGDVTQTEVALSQTDLENLSSTPVTVLAAPGANKVVCVIGAIIQVNLTVLYSAGAPTISLRYDGLGTDLTTTVAPSFTANTGVKHSIMDASGSGLNFAPASDIRNVAVVLRGNADLTTGAGTATGTIVITSYTADFS